MERNLHEPEIYDFRQHDRLWQRVGPGLEPIRKPRRKQCREGRNCRRRKRASFPARSRTPAAWAARQWSF